MAMNSGSLDKWRDYFRTANSDIFAIIEHAIMVAASDCPKELRLRRDQIAEILFSCKLGRCYGCDRIELAVPGDVVDDDDEDEGCKSGSDTDRFKFEAGGCKESKVKNSHRDDHVDMNMNHVSNYSFGEAEALTDEIEEEGQIVGEVLRIKEILHNSQDESDSVLCDSLRRLQLMALSVDTLKSTEIGKAVNGLRKHGLRQIRDLARTLIDMWKDMVDEWVNATTAIAEGTPESVNPSVVDEEEGLPSPPLDEGFFLAGPTTTMELSQFFDCMDDDGNPRNGGEFKKNRENGRKPSMESQNVPRRKQPLPNESKVPAKDNKGEQVKKQEAVMRKQTAIVKPHKHSNTESGPGRPAKPNVVQKVNNETKFQQKSDKVAIQKKPLAAQQDKLQRSDEDAVRMKLEATKRRLGERYQQAENAKRQRMIQVMELHDLPKQGLGHKNAHIRPGRNNWHGASGRR
ncbi:probable mediator of RNA polymerase II transcription subunit 26b isoform X2 [Cornus florida]|uniref:probable mediator of RNA polymerase II transcription subunit 26b isoform X2 n=1 Tax=Cornus florida TaxID=4283 RepID=UPI00289A7AD8|nr:probable mediator of RNA polymerase II transcription subunit 26b isoform X2 [Cornus florida]